MYVMFRYHLHTISLNYMTVTFQIFELSSNQKIGSFHQDERWLRLWLMNFMSSLFILFIINEFQFNTCGYLFILLLINFIFYVKFFICFRMCLSFSFYFILLLCLELIFFWVFGLISIFILTLFLWVWFLGWNFY